MVNDYLSSTLQSVGISNIKEPRKDAVSMARLGSGHSLELGAYCQRIGKLQDGTCRRCFEECEDTEHVLKCEAGLWRRRLKGLLNQPC